MRKIEDEDMDLFALDIVTPEWHKTLTEVELVEIPSIDGDLGVYAGHAPLLTGLSVGEMRVYQNNEITCYALAGGFAEVRPERMRIVATFATPGEDDARIEEACLRAKSALETAENENPAVIQAEVESLKFEMLKLSEELRRKRISRGK